MDQRTEQSYVKEQRFTFSNDENRPDLNRVDLHKEYVEQYQKYSASLSDPLNYLETGETARDQTLKQQDWKRMTSERMTQYSQIIKQLQLQNSELVGQIGQSQVYLKQLQARLLGYETSMRKMQELCRYQQEVILEMGSQIALILNRNQQLEGQLSEIRKKFEFVHQSMQFSDMNLQKIEQNIYRRSQSQYNPKTYRRSTDHKDIKNITLHNTIKNAVNSDVLTKSYREEQKGRSRSSFKQGDRREVQLVGRIKDMYSKIMESDINTLNQLWKWLKQIGQVYSFLRKLKRRARDKVIQQVPSKNQTSQQLLEEVFSYIIDL